MQRQVDGAYAYMTNEEKRFAARSGESFVDNRDVTNLLRTDIRTTSFVYPGEAAHEKRTKTPLY